MPAQEAQPTVSHVLPLHRNPTALIVDDDVGFIFWLGDIFGRAGWNLVPALNCRQAVSLAVLWDSYIDLVVVNPAISGVSEMVETLSRVHRPRVVILRDPDVEVSISADATLDRPDVEALVPRAEWAKRMRELLRNIAQQRE